MDKKIVLLLTLFIMISVFTACQSTPEKPVVIQKDMEQMIEKAQTSADTAYMRSLKEQLDVPDTLVEELTSAEGKLKIHVNAEIDLPDVTAVPAAAIGMGAFTQDDVQRLYKTLCKDATPIDPENTGKTQAWKMRTIQGLLDQKKSGKLDTAKYDSAEELDAAIQKEMAEAAGLPKHFERTEPDFSFKPFADDGTESAHLRVAPDDATISDLTVFNIPEGQGGSYAEYCRDLMFRAALSGIIADSPGSFLQTESQYFKPPSISEEAARKLADDTAAALGLEDFVCSGRRMSAMYNAGVDAEDAPRVGVYEYMYTRQIGGVPVTYTNDDGDMIDAGPGKKDTAFYDVPWLYEKVRIIIDDKGILELQWNSPYTVTNIVTSSSAMLPFKDIQNTFEKMIPVVDNIYDSSDQGLTCDMYISEVKLGLMRVTEKDIGTSGLVIPVWDFMGYTKDSNGNIFGKDGYTSLLTVNAIDGSVIDRSFGY